MQMNLPDFFATDLVVTLAFGILAILLIIVGYITFDKLTPKLDFNDLISKGNVSMGIVVAGFILGLCYVVAHVISAILTSGTT
jgi:uncharacterized membrane protein YjfL (UPF0719 family)